MKMQLEQRWQAYFNYIWMINNFIHVEMNYTLLTGKSYFIAY